MDDVGFDFLYVDEPEIEIDDSLEHVDDEPDDCTGDLSDDEEGEKNDPITLSNVRAARSRLHQDDILGKVKKILDCMRD
jgi:hypothetical protein